MLMAWTGQVPGARFENTVPGRRISGAGQRPYWDGDIGGGLFYGPLRVPPETR
jgi:hypothetical protein